MNAGLCLSDPHPDYVNDGNSKRTLSASHFAGRYRLVDFMLSNMVNSGIHTIGMILNSEYQSLIGHIGMGKEWDLARKSGGVTFFPPYLTDERQSINNELAGPLQRAMEYLAASKAEYIVLTEASVVYNMDYRRVIEAHKKSKADVTAVYAKKHVGFDERENTVVYELSDGGRVRSIAKAPQSADVQNVSLGTYVTQRQVLLQLLGGEKNCGMLRFSCELLGSALKRMKVSAYEFKGYSAQISSAETYFRYNGEMLDIEKRNDLFGFEGRRISTSRRDSLPTKYGKASSISNSIIADGCQIDGTVKNCVIFRNVRIKPGAVVKNCVLQENTVVESNAELDWIITDRMVIISEGRKMIGYRTYPVYIERDRIV